jgi:glycosyltransferase involved in cell wall biosynthesis
MRIVHLIAGAGGMYCGSCLHGNTLVRALRALGEDVLLVPLYTPLRVDEPDASLDRVALGGINVYLQQQSAFFRNTPWFFDRLLDHPRLLGWLGRRGWSTRPEDLGPLTQSMIQGEQGRQRREIRKLSAWLKREVRPDLVHLSNVMLVGTARQLGRELGVPIVSTLNGEDAFLEQLVEPHHGAVRAELRERCRDLDGLVAMSRYSAEFMAEYLGVARERIHVIPPGLDLDGHAAGAAPEPSGEKRASPPEPPVIGFLSRICPEKGLHQLAEAFAILAAEPGLPPVSLRAAGYMHAGDRPYLERIRADLGDRGLADRFDYVGELDRPGKIRFLRSLGVMCLPTPAAESKPLAVLEAWANGVPVVLPNHGPYPEMVADTAGGLLYEPDGTTSLVAALRRMVLEPGLAAHHGRRAEETVRDRYHARRMAEQMRDWYHKVVADRAQTSVRVARP